MRAQIEALLEAFETGRVSRREVASRLAALVAALAGGRSVGERAGSQYL